METSAAYALARFGLGAKLGEPQPAHLRPWLRAQLQAPDPAIFIGLPSTAEGLTALMADRADKKSGVDNPIHRSKTLYHQDVTAQVDQAIDSLAPFRERLVLFWANHFTVSIHSHEITPIAGCFVREAIRPYVTARFEDMALAVLRHPAMLMYLNNAGSVGPNSRAGQRSGRGLNENLARETMELHTLGADGG